MSKEIKYPPSFGLTALAFSHDTSKNFLVASAWDRKLRIYDTDAGVSVSTYDYDMPILDCTFCNSDGDPPKVVAGGFEKDNSGTVILYDIASETGTLLGRHSQPVRCVRFHKPTGLFYSGGWDRIVRCWDPRCPTKVAEILLHGKIYCMDVSIERLVVTDSVKRTYIFNAGQPANFKPESYRESILKFQARCLRCFPNGEGFALSSIEGRVAWEYFSRDPETQSRKYAFKCHREKGDYKDEVIYPVHALAFHPIFGTFATGGGDGGVALWDGYSKKRMFRYQQQPTSVTALAFNKNGTQLAIGVSYAYEKGPCQSNESIPTNIIIHNVDDEEAQPKKK